MMAEEMKKIGYIAGPMAGVMLMQIFLQLIPMIMVGHLASQLSLSSTALALSFAAVSGFNVLLGMAGALETLCGQAYGAQEYQKLGVLTYTAILSLTIVSFPLSLVWIFMGKMLTLIHQDPLISHEAGKFSRCLLPSLFGYAFLQPLIRFFQAQSLILPLLVSSGVAFFIHIPLCWLLVFKSGLGHLGAAFSMDISIWVNAVLLGLFMKFSSACARTRAPLSIEVLAQMPRFFRLAVPSALMLCLEYWSFELLVLLSGLLPNPKLETSVLSLCLTTSGTLFTIAYGLGAAASTRVSNELGSGKPQAAQTAVRGAMLLALTEALMATAALLGSRRSLGYLFSNDKQVINYYTVMSPLVTATVAIDAFQGVLTGIARGCGWQKMATYINIGAYYLFGIPIAVVIGFVRQLRGKGLWSGIIIGAIIQTAGLSILTTFTDWDTEVSS
ncbi:hypothetical protein Nepgr_026352 [Nepenthes gracilis]|uniref:Multidrug and toxic compound extrusion protein n=1 Tax=Nepenthes gracilis TaxID=150966 RepID=A0AAD3Y1Z8_NEPGR|nr:hypothetical protein Nepgr_026352 [Nepenthes gracilis]